MHPLNVGFALTGSFCTFRRVLPEMQRLVDAGHNVTPIMSYNAYSLDTRFGKAETFRNEIENITGNRIIATLTDAEPIGPKKSLDILLIEPCTGNTLAKLASGISDTPVTMAAKSHLRNLRPLVIAISSNDALAGAAKNIAMLQNYKNVFFVPYRQDAPEEKPNSIVADFSRTEDAIIYALQGRQIQPLLLQ
jgi:dipicolinate synthase subunit B